jgi:hypothetical protein
MLIRSFFQPHFSPSACQQSTANLSDGQGLPIIFIAYLRYRVRPEAIITEDKKYEPIFQKIF